MRALLVLLAVALAVGLPLILWLDPSGAPPDRQPDGPPAVERPAAAGSAGGSEQAATPDRPVVGNLAPLESHGNVEAVPVEPLDGAVRLSPFHGQALLQRDGDIPRAAARGHIELDVIHGGRRESLTVNVVAGRFEARIPEVARIRIVGGQLEGQAVHFLGVDALFDPKDDEYVLVGEPVPASVIVALDALSGAPLSGLTLRRGEEPTAARLVDTEPGAPTPGASGTTPLLENAASPITLPWIDASHPVWIHVDKAGYAPASVLVEPGREAAREVRMWPEATLTVRIMGPGRERLRALVLLREEGEGRTPHAATFSVTDAGVHRDADAIVFAIEGLAALTHRVEAKGYDGQGRATDLGDARTDLVAGRPGLVTLVVEER